MDLFSVLIISLIIFVFGCWGLFVNKRNIVIFIFLDIIYFAGLFLFFKIYGFKLYLFSFFIGYWYWSLVNNLYVIKLISAEIMYFAALFYFFEAYAFNLSFFESVHLTLMSKTSSNADEEFYLLQSFIHEVHRNQFFISEFYVNNFYNTQMKIHLIEYVEFFANVKIDAISSNFIDELNYNNYIRICDDNINLIRPIIEKNVLREKETMAYYNALEDNDYYTNLLENANFFFYTINNIFNYFYIWLLGFVC